MDDDPTLAQLRREISQADAELLAVLARRRAIVQRLAAWKAAHGLPAIDLAREARVREAWRDQAGALALPASLADALLDRVLEDSRGLVSQPTPHGRSSEP